MTDSPPNTDPLDRDAIAALAYRLWQQRGCPVGSGELDWYEAEALLRQHSLRQAAPKRTRAPKTAKTASAEPTPKTRVTRSRPARPDA